MSHTGLKVFDSSLQKTNLWLGELADLLQLETKQKAYKALRAVLHTLRDVMSLEEVAQFSAQLPLILRGVYYEGWKPADKPLKLRTKDAFLKHVDQELNPGFDEPRLDTQDVTEAVFRLLSWHISDGELEDIRALLAKPIKDLWQETLFV